MPELPPILHSQRFRSLFLSLTLLAFAGYTLTSVEQAADASFPSTYPSSSAGQGAYRDGAEADAQSSASQSKWRPSAWNVPSWAGSAFGGGKSVVQSNAQALGWVGEHPESLEGWEEGSLKHWKACTSTSHLFIPSASYRPADGEEGFRSSLACCNKSRTYAY